MWREYLYAGNRRDRRAIIDLQDQKSKVNSELISVVDHMNGCVVILLSPLYICSSSGLGGRSPNHRPQAMPVEANTSPRYSLQPPCGLPPLFSLPPGQSQNTEANQVDGVRRSAATTHDEGGDTLISCFGTLSISSLPLKDESTEVIGAPSARTKLYPGPKLSDRATQGPDAGPLIDRFSCLFQDRELHVANFN